MNKKKIIKIYMSNEKIKLKGTGMKKTNERLIEGSEVPLLEQEKIDDIFFDGIKEYRIEIKYRRLKMLMTFLASVIAVLLICIFVILSSRTIDSDNRGDKYSSGVSESKDGELTDVAVRPPDTVDTNQETSAPAVKKDIYEYDFSAVLEGEMPIVPKDISSYEKGASYIINSTGFVVDTKALLQSDLKTGSTPELLTANSSPKVLIVHTHSSEAYNTEERISYFDNGGELMRSDDAEKNVMSIGEYLAELLNKKGISTVHCSVIHDNMQYKDSFSRSESTVREYLEKYPSIKLVIDLHRDSLINSEGHIIRPVTLVDGEETAQIQCVVGSSWGGEECPNWQKNLSLAMKLREKLNASYTNICRPPELSALAYNQNLSEYSLMLLIGSCGNSLEEAKNAVECISDSLAELIGCI